MEYTYQTKGVCARSIRFEVEEGVLRNISFMGGCDGNLKGVSVLAEGMEPAEALKRLQGISCGAKATSCPDQLAKALSEFLENR